MDRTYRHIGRCRIALVHGGGTLGDAPAIGLDTAVNARMLTDSDPGPVQFEGPAVFTPPVRKHIVDTVLPAALVVARGAGCKPGRFALSAVNLGAASLQGRVTEISGFSADAPVFLALVSAATSIPLPDGLLAMGHLASPAGDLRPVQCLVEKLEAAARSEAVTHFVYAAPAADGSATALAPEDCEQFRCALARAKGRVKTIPVTDAGELVRAAFAPGNIVRGALERGFYKETAVPAPGDTALDRAVHHLCAGHGSRFWETLENHFLTINLDGARRLLDAWFGYHVREGMYPAGFGTRLTGLVHALPRAARRAVLRARLIPAESGLRLTRLAGGTDLDDLRELTRFLTGEVAAPVAPAVSRNDTKGPARGGGNALAELLEAISPEALAAIRRPLDDARNHYPGGDVVAADHETFLDAVEAFYRHLAGCHEGWPVPVEAAAGRAIDLVEEAFRNQGGLAGARAEARDAVHGGMRYVYDAMMDTYIRRVQTRFVNAALVQAFDPLDWEARLALTAELLAAIAPGLPPDTAGGPPERYVGAAQQLARLYVQAMEPLRAALRAL